jgi:hypothetical protein
MAFHLHREPIAPHLAWVHNEEKQQYAACTCMSVWTFNQFTRYQPIIGERMNCCPPPWFVFCPLCELTHLAIIGTARSFHANRQAMFSQYVVFAARVVHVAAVGTVLDARELGTWWGSEMGCISQRASDRRDLKQKTETET